MITPLKTLTVVALVLLGAAGARSQSILDDFSNVRDRAYSANITAVGVSSAGATIERITPGCNGLSTIRLSSTIVRPGAVVTIIDGTTTETVIAEMTAGSDFTARVVGGFNPGDAVSRRSLSFTVFGTGEITSDVSAVLRARQTVRLAMQALDPVQVAIVLLTNRGEIRKDFDWISSTALLEIEVPRKARLTGYRLHFTTGAADSSRLRLYGLSVVH
jgi:hypothetical protein